MNHQTGFSFFVEYEHCQTGLIEEEKLFNLICRFFPGSDIQRRFKQGSGTIQVLDAEISAVFHSFPEKHLLTADFFQMNRKPPMPVIKALKKEVRSGRFSIIEIKRGIL